MSAVTIDSLGASMDQLFLIVMGMIVFFMQCGFAFLEAGAVRVKNTTNILMKNIMDCAIAGIVYWACGYAFAYGKDSNAFIGHSHFFLIDLPSSEVAGYFFQFGFAATAATIVSGAMAERTSMYAYFIYSVIITGFIYPVVSHWVWDSNGWLLSKAPWDNVSYMDFAGSSVVHAVGGMAGLMGAIALGRRIEQFNNNTRQRERIRGHTIPLMCLGGMILFFGFFAFNGGSQLSISHAGDAEVVSKAILNTILSGYAGGIVAVIIAKIRSSKFSVLQCINGTLTGMVAICAGCNVMEPWSALVTGCVAGVTFAMWSEALFRVGVDDPLDAVAVHLGGGLWGILAAPLFARENGVMYNWNALSFQLLLWNLIGATVICIWTGVSTAAMFWGMRLVGILRVGASNELAGLDEREHGEPAYDPMMIDILTAFTVPKPNLPHYTKKNSVHAENGAKENFQSDEM